MSSIMLPKSVVETIEQTGSPSAGLRKFKQLRGLIPVQEVYDLALGGVAKKEQLRQFCAVFAPQVQPAVIAFKSAQVDKASASTTRKPKATRKSEPEVVTISAAELRSLEQRIEALEAGLGAETPKASKATTKAKPRKTEPKAKAVVKDDDVHTFTANAVESRDIPTKSGAKFTWKRRKGGESKWVVVKAHRDGSVDAKRA